MLAFAHVPKEIRIKLVCMTSIPGIGFQWGACFRVAGMEVQSLGLIKQESINMGTLSQRWSSTSWQRLSVWDKFTARVSLRNLEKIIVHTE